MPRKMARQTLERHAGACCAGSRPYLGSGLLGSPENRYNLPHFRVHPGNPGLGHVRLVPKPAVGNRSNAAQRAALCPCWTDDLLRLGGSAATGA